MKKKSVVDLKDLEISELKDQQKILNWKHEEKLEELRNKLMSTEKNIYLKIEGEYYQILQEKDEMLKD